MRPYDHLERLGGDEVEGIDVGTVHVYPKLDGANGRVSMRDGTIIVGSRTRIITPDNDMQGLAAWVYEMQASFSQLIPRLLETVFHDLVTEELWTPLKKAGFPSVNFKKLRAFSNALVKEFACDLF